MNALEPEPEGKGRMGRLGMGLAIALTIGTGVVFAADQVTPARRALNEVVKIAIVDEPPPPKQDEPPPPPPMQPPPKPKPLPKAAKPQPQQPVSVAEPVKPTDNPPPEPVGLDADSFGSGSGGPAFAMGTTQMGNPGEAARTVVPEPKPQPKVIEARPKAGNPSPPYTDRARRMAIEGLMVIEASVDARGRVTNAVVRGKLEPLLDESARKTVLGWKFEPATLEGRPIASTKWLRIRFELERRGG